MEERTMQKKNAGIARNFALKGLLLLAALTLSTGFFACKVAVGGGEGDKLPPPKEEEPSEYHNVVFHTGGGEWAESYTVPTQFNDTEDFFLPIYTDIKREGFSLAGWFTDEACTGAKVYDIPKGTIKTNIELWPKWVEDAYTAETIGNVLQNLEGEGPHSVKIVGKISDDTIGIIADILRDASKQIKVNLDMTECYGLERFVSAAHGDGKSFYNCVNLTGICLPDDLETIDYLTFRDCSSLESVTIPASVKKINYMTAGSRRGNAFSYAPALKEIIISPDSEFFTAANNVIYTKDMTALVLYPAGITAESFTVPEGITEIYTYAFDKNTYLKTLTLPDGIEKIGSCILRDCTGVLNLEIPGSVVECGSLNSISDSSCLENVIVNCESVPNLGSYSGKSSLKTLKLNEGVKNLTGEVLRNCANLTELHLPASLTNIAGNESGNPCSVFAGCTGLEIITVDESNPVYCSIDNSIYTKDKSTLIFYNPARSEFSPPEGVQLTAIGKLAFGDLHNIKTMAIPDSVKEIGEQAFYSASVEQITLPNSLTSIRDYVFRSCALKSIEIPAGVETIGSWAFAYTDLESIEIPANVSSIGAHAFDCENLKSVTVRSSEPPVLGNDIFCSFPNPVIPTIYVPNESLETYKNAPGWSEYAEYIKQIP